MLPRLTHNAFWTSFGGDGMVEAPPGIGGFLAAGTLHQERSVFLLSESQAEGPERFHDSRLWVEVHGVFVWLAYLSKGWRRCLYTHSSRIYQFQFFNTGLS